VDWRGGLYEWWGEIIVRLADAAGALKLRIFDSTDTEVAAIDSDGNITCSGTVDTVDIAAHTHTGAAGDGTYVALAYAEEPSTANVTITATTSGTAQDITGVSASLAAGTWLVAASFDVQCDDKDTTFVGLLDVDGSDEAEVCAAILTTVDGVTGRLCVAQSWLITLATAKTVKLQGYKTAAVGTMVVNYPHTKYCAVRVV